MAATTIWFIEIPLVASNEYDRSQLAIGCSVDTPELVDELYLRRYLNDIEE